MLLKTGGTSQVSKTPVATSLDTHGLAYLAGVRVGDHVMIRTEPAVGNNERVHFDVTTREGTEKQLSLVRTRPTSWNQPRFDQASNQIIFNHFSSQSYGQLLELAAKYRSPNVGIRFADLGLVTTRFKAALAPRIVDVVRNSPADKAGVELGAQLMGLQSEPSAPSDPDRVAQILEVQQPDGTRLSFQAVGNMSQLKRWGDIRLASVTSGVLVLQFNEFSESSERWIHDQVVQNPGKPVVLDLRNNTGGLATSMTKILGEFLPPNTLIATQTEAHGKSDIRVAPTATPSSAKLAVLVGPISTSATEVTASALKHYGRAMIIGWPTAGEVVIAKTYSLRNGGLIQIPFASVVDAGGQELEGYGITPDINLWNTLADIRAGRDVPLECAVHVASGQTCQ